MLCCFGEEGRESGGVGMEEAVTTLSGRWARARGCIDRIAVEEGGRGG